MTHIVYASEFKARAVEAVVGSGATIRETAAELGVPYDSLRVWCRNAGVSLTPRADAVTIASALQMLADGTDVRTVASAVGFAPCTIWRWRSAAKEAP